MMTKMKLKTITAVGILMLYLISMIAFASAIVVDAGYITTYSGEDASIKVEVENNFDYDIEEVSVKLNLENLPFTAISSSEKELDDLDENDDDSATFTLKVSNDVVPGDYNIPYVVSYTNVDTDNESTKEGSFGIRVSAKTDIDFSLETSGENSEAAIVGQKGKISFKIINQGLGEVKFVSVQIFPSDYELLSNDKIYIGNIDSDDSDFATFDVIFKSASPIFSAKIEYKDFDNNDQTETIAIPMKVYTQEKALEFGLIQKPNYVPYFVAVVLIIIWLVWRKIKKSRKNKNRGR